jgi:hypothetical protein
VSKCSIWPRKELSKMRRYFNEDLEEGIDKSTFFWRAAIKDVKPGDPEKRNRCRKGRVQYEEVSLRSVSPILIILSTLKCR